MAVVISGTNNNDKITATDGTIDLLSGVNFSGEVEVPSFKVGSNIQFGNAGIITATTLVGNVQGNINHTSNLLLQISGSEKFRVGTSGQLGIGGANYGTSGQVLTSGGSSSAATWSTISGTTINNNANNRVITGSGTANTLEGESNLTFSGNTLEVNNIIKLSDAGFLKFGVSNTAFVRGKDDTDGYLQLGTVGAERLRIDSTGRLLLGSGAIALPKGSAAGSFDLDNGNITMCIGGNSNSTGRTNSTDKINRITSPHYTNAEEPVALLSSFNISGSNSISYGGGSGQTNAATRHIFYTAANTTTTTGTERLRIDSSGHIHTGYTSGFGNDHLNILASDGGGVAIAQQNVGDASNGTTIGSLSFQGYLSGASHSSAEAKISAITAADHTGTSAATDLVFYTKPSTVGPGSSPSERFRISSNGNLEWRNRSVKQRKHGAFLGINSAGTSDIKISGNFENNDMLRVRWAYNWNAGDGGAWGEAVIWKQYEGTKRVRYLTDVKASPLTSVSFPHSGNDIWLRWQTNAGINGWYMIDVECHGCDPFPF